MASYQGLRNVIATLFILAFIGYNLWMLLPQFLQSVKQRMTGKTISDADEKSRNRPQAFCPPPELPGKWHQVYNECFVFSAFIDNRPKINVVRIIGAHPRLGKGPNKCRLVFASRAGQQIVDAQLNITYNEENHGHFYSAFIYTCAIPPDKNQTLPCGVQLYSTNHTHRMGLLPITKPQVPRVKFKYVICVPTLHDYNGVNILTDTTEANRLFGASHYVFYNTSQTRNVSRYLEYYEKHEVATRIPWLPPEPIMKGIHYYGQLIAIQDCYYRHRTLTKYIGFWDTDEVIVPHNNASNWDQLLQEVARNSSQQTPKKGGYYFRNKFFKPCGNWTAGGPKLEEQLRQEAEHFDLLTVLTRTSGGLWDHKQRTKLIVDADAVVNMGIHCVFEYFPGYGDIPVAPSMGLLHHYRGEGHNCSVGTSPDSTMDKFARQLIDRVRKVHEGVKREFPG